MRGLHFATTGSLDALTLREDLPRPQPGPGDALVRVRAAGVNPSDPKNVLGRMSHTTLPRVPGRDFAGVVEAGAAEWLGREVYGSGAGLGFTRDGTHAEWVAVPAAALVEKPAALSFEEAAALGVPFVTAAEMVQAAGVAAGDVVLVLGGAGAVGAAAAQLAKARGARVLGTRRRAAVPPAAAAAVDRWIDLPAGADVAAAVRAAAGERGPDAVLDAVGGPLFEAAVRTLAHRGRYVVVASAPPRVALDLVDFYRREARLAGVDSLKRTAAECAAILSSLAPTLAAGALRPPEVEPVPLARGREAYAAALAGAPRKLVLVP